jgi:hypothetical protein
VLLPTAITVIKSLLSIYYSSVTQGILLYFKELQQKSINNTGTISQCLTSVTGKHFSVCIKADDKKASEGTPFSNSF